jgi:hypothetical protein
LRLRQAYGTYDNDDWHSQFLGGQAWSLLAQDRLGVVPRMENVPLTIDAQYAVGFDWTRNGQLRFVGDWNKVAWFGVSVESPQSTSFRIRLAPTPSWAGPQGAPLGARQFHPGSRSTTSKCVRLLDSSTGTACSADTLPVVIEQPHWSRLGSLRTLWPTTLVYRRMFTTATPGGGTNKPPLGGELADRFSCPLCPNTSTSRRARCTAKGLVGTDLANCLTSRSHSRHPHILLGAVGHSWEGLDIYASQELASRNASVVTGYGTSLFSDAGCFFEHPGSGPAPAKRFVRWNRMYGQHSSLQEVTLVSGRTFTRVISAEPPSTPSRVPNATLSLPCSFPERDSDASPDPFE